MIGARLVTPAWRLATSPAAALYAGAAALRRALYQQGVLCASRLAVPVISVGGLALGGQGQFLDEVRVPQQRRGIVRRRIVVGFVHRRQFGTLVGCQHKETPICRIDMCPYSVLPADAYRIRQRVHRPRVHRAGAPHHEERAVPVRSIGDDPALEHVGPHVEPRI